MYRSPDSDPAFFDLDGTLVDSAQGIILSLENALGVCGVPCPGIDWRRFIGPPLPRMLEAALPGLDTSVHEAVVTAFRAHYAAVGVYETRAFPGIMPLLEGLARAGRTLHIVTNKPQALADAIVYGAGFSPLIRRVSGGDLGGRTSKAERLAILAEEEGVEAGAFVGDTLDDLEAAQRIGARFLLAGWGYGAAVVLAKYPDVEVARDPAAVSTLLAVDSA